MGRAEPCGPPGALRPSGSCFLPPAACHLAYRRLLQQQREEELRRQQQQEEEEESEEEEVRSAGDREGEQCVRGSRGKSLP